MNKIITKTYKPQKTEFPIWKQTNRVVLRHYQFDLSDAVKHDAQGRGFPYLIWKHEDVPYDKSLRVENDHLFYNGCSYRWHGYNPTPVTGWFRGVPLGQMFKWCEEHGLTNPTLVRESVEITYEDISNDNDDIF